MDEFLPTDTLRALLKEAFQKRESLFSDPDTDAYRMFNGFCEGFPSLSIDRYARTAVILWMNKKAAPGDALLSFLCETCLNGIPGIDSVLLKNRFGSTPEEKNGILLRGTEPARSIREWGVSYPVNLRLNKDCGFYLDSSLLRRWLIGNAAGKRVLNTFAYTGSLGDAAAAGGALSVTQTDLNPNYLSSRHSSQEYILGDFFHVASALRRSGRLFDLIILDPPFFAGTNRGGKVDPARDPAALINKIRPLAAHRGKIIAVNNALFLSGKDFLSRIESLSGPWLSVSEIIPVPDSFFGFAPVDGKALPADPAPFNHPTKIVVLDILRKDERA